MRLFVSVALHALAEEIATVQQPLASVSGLRLTDPEQAHLTLKFLGETPEGDVPELREAIAAAVTESGVSQFRMELGGLGVFPHLDDISVVWLGVGEGGAECSRLHRAIEAATTDLGFEPEDHEFTPHVTLARMDHAGGKSRVQELVTERDPTAGATTVTGISLTESTLTADGPVYETVEWFELPR